MAYKSLLTVAVSAERSEQAVTGAAALAAANDAHLDILALGVDRTQVGYSYIGTGAVVLQAAVDRAEQDAKEIETAVRRAIASQPPTLRWTVEAAVTQGPEAEAAVDEALAPLLGAGADVFVLGCTHYPFLRPVIERRLPDGGVVIDTGPAVARRVASLLPAPGPGCPGAILVETTGEIGRLDALLPRLLPGLAVRSAGCRIGNTPP